MNEMARNILACGVELQAGTGKEGDTGVWRFVFPKNFPGFGGHFPGAPILPAIVQIMAARLVAARAWGLKPDTAWEIASVGRAKFLLPLGPDQEIRVECQIQGDLRNPGARATVYRDGDLAASFRLGLDSGAAV